MGSIEYATKTSATPGRALDFLADLNNLTEFVHEVEKVERSDEGYAVSLDRGLIMPDMVVQYTVSRPEGAVVAEGTHRSIHVVDRWDVSATETGGAEVRYHGTYELKGPTKLVAPLARYFSERGTDDLATRLGESLDALEPG